MKILFNKFQTIDTRDDCFLSEDRIDVDSENETGEWGSDANDSESEVVVMTPEEQAFPNSRIRLLQIMVSLKKSPTDIKNVVSHINSVLSVLFRLYFLCT